MPTKEHEIINVHSWRDSNGYCQDFEPTKENMEIYFSGMNLEDYESPNIPGERMLKVTDDALKVKMKILIKDFTKKIKIPTSEQTKQLEIIEEKFDVVEPAVINMNKDRKNTIIGGHQRIKAAQELGLTTFPCVEVDLNEKQERELNVRLNKNTGQFDFEKLIEQFEMDDLESWGFVEADFSELEEKVAREKKDPDAVPEIPEEAITNLGDIYQLGEHRLMCGDSTDIKTVEKLMGDEKADLIVTDPPYNVSYTGKTKDALTIKNDSMKDESFFQFLYDAFTNYLSIANPGCGIYVFHADTEGLNFRRALKESGFELKQCCIWVKQTMVMGRQDYHWKHEPVLYGWKGGAAHNWYTDRKQTTVWEFDRPFRNDIHPTMKPVDLIEYPINNSSKSGDLVVDFFGGSGTALIACEQTKRKCYMMELDPIYCDVIVKRWEEFTGKKAELINGQ